MKARLIGIDINGWHDFAVRNWQLGHDGIKRFFPDGYRIIDGGKLSRSVEVGDDSSTEVKVHGPRAHLAIHGKGLGWGDFGDDRRRDLIRKSKDLKGWGPLMRELGPDPSIAVLAVPDHGIMNEMEREKRLKAMRALSARRTMLVWSSVALGLVQCN